MANSLFMVESPPLLEPHSEAKMVTWRLLEPWIWSHSWSGYTLDAIKNHINQHVHSMCSKSLKQIKEKQNKQTHWRVVFLKNDEEERVRGKTWIPHSGSAPWTSWVSSPKNEEVRGRTREYKKRTAENKTKQVKIAMNTVFCSERNSAILKESFHQKLKKTVYLICLTKTTMYIQFIKLNIPCQVPVVYYWVNVRFRYIFWS